MTDKRLKNFYFSKSEIAILFGVSMPAVSKWGLDALPVHKVTTGNMSKYYMPDLLGIKLKRASVEASRLDLSQERAALAKVQASKCKVDIDRAKLDKVKTKLEIAKMEYDLAERRKELIPASELRCWLERIIHTYRAKKLSIPARLAPRLTECLELSQVEQMLVEAEEEALTELSLAKLEELGIKAKD